jgi:anti-sigma factor RsiW
MNRHVTHLLSAYVHGELAPHLRLRVTRHLDSCDSCYAALCRERDLTRTLADQLPAFGAPQPDQLARLLPDILAETVPQTPPSPRLSGMAVAMVLSLVLVIMVPALMMPRVSVVAAPDQPAPYMIAATATRSVTDAPGDSLPVSPTAVAVLDDRATEPPALNPSPVPEVQMTPGPHSGRDTRY